MFSDFAIWATLALSVSAAAIDKRATCSSYSTPPSPALDPSTIPLTRRAAIINTRGTGEAQGPSAGFRTMNANVQRQLPGGKIYNTVYPASFSQNSAAGTTDIVNKVTSTLRGSPNECFILEGYSQGAAATVDALPRLTGSTFAAVKGVFLIGDPDHKSGLACNVDNNGGTTTRNVNGLSAFGAAGIPSNWVAKTLDVCIYVSRLSSFCFDAGGLVGACPTLLTGDRSAQGDGVCDTTHGYGINAQHLQYPSDSPTQNLGTNFIVNKLKNG